MVKIDSVLRGMSQGIAMAIFWSVFGGKKDAGLKLNSTKLWKVFCKIKVVSI